MATKSTFAIEIFYVGHIRFCSQYSCKINIFKSHIISVCRFRFSKYCHGCRWRHSITLSIAIIGWHVTIFPWIPPYEIFSRKWKSIQINHFSFETSHCLIASLKFVHHRCNIFQIQQSIVVGESCIGELVFAMIIQKLVSEKSFGREVLVCVFEVSNN